MRDDGDGGCKVNTGRGAVNNDRRRDHHPPVPELIYRPPYKIFLAVSFVLLFAPSTCIHDILPACLTWRIPARRLALPISVICHQPQVSILSDANMVLEATMIV